MIKDTLCLGVELQGSQPATNAQINHEGNCIGPKEGAVITV